MEVSILVNVFFVYLFGLGLALPVPPLPPLSVNIPGGWEVEIQEDKSSDCKNSTRPFAEDCQQYCSYTYPEHTYPEVFLIAKLISVFWKFV